MPTVRLTNDEYHRILTERNRESLIGGYCEDYPCCGHSDADPCTREWYDHPDAFNPSVNPHCFCEHEYGICDVDDYDEDVAPEDCDHDDTATRRGRVECRICGSLLMVVTDVSPRAYPSKVIPGMMVEIPVLGWHLEVRS